MRHGLEATALPCVGTEPGTTSTMKRTEHLTTPLVPLAGLRRAQRVLAPVVWSGLTLFGPACDEPSGRGTGPFAPGGKADDTNSTPVSSPLDGDMLRLLDEAAAHLGDEEDWSALAEDDMPGDDPPDDAPGGDGMGDDGPGDDGMGDDGPGDGMGDDGPGDDGMGDDGPGDDGPGDDGMGDDGAGDGGMGEPGPSCAGVCETDVDQGGCFCDAACLDFGDCCADYESVCAAAGGSDPGADALEVFDAVTRQPGAQHTADPVGDLMQDIDPSMFSKSCLKILDGDVEVSKIITAAGRDAKKYGGRCFVAAVYATTSTGGALAPASVVCVAATAGGGALGAAKSYIKQKRGDISLCAAESAELVVSAVIDALEWLGWFEMAADNANTEEEELAAIEGLGNPKLECTGPYNETNYHDESACGPLDSPPPECWQIDEDTDDYCEDLREAAERWARCRWGRVVAANTAWDGKPNKAHRTPIKRAEQYQDHCITFLKEECNEDWSFFDDELRLRQEAKELICN